MEYVINYLEWFLFSYFGGSCIIIVGLIKIYKQTKSSDKIDGSILQPYMSGWAFGIGSFILGIIIIVFKFLGKI